MTAREKLVARIRNAETEANRLTAALEVLDEMGLLEAAPGQQIEATGAAEAKKKRSHKKQATGRTPTSQPAPPPAPKPNDGSAAEAQEAGCKHYGDWDGAHPSCRKCDAAANCRAATPVA